MRVRHRQQSLLTLILFLMVTVSTFTTCLGMWDYYGSCYPKLTPEVEEYMWYRDAYYFLYSDDDGYFYPDVLPTYNLPAYNQNIGSGTAKYWLDDANRLYLVGSYEKAAESYARAVNLDPSLSQCWLNLGNSLYFLGRYQASLNAYGAVLRLDPQNANALTGKSQALSALNNTFGPSNSTMIPSTVQ
jgi:tetratricopeptide (TPR) repeat protein